MQWRRKRYRRHCLQQSKLLVLPNTPLISLAAAAAI